MAFDFAVLWAKYQSLVSIELTTVLSLKFVNFFFKRLPQERSTLRAASSSCGWIEEVELIVSVQLAPHIARAGRLIQVVPHAILVDPRESTCKGVTPSASDVPNLHRLCD
jgi:hypothetical protein